jgi:hypothetical protein
MKSLEEIPDTEQGLRLYIAYCRKQIKANENANKRLKTRIAMSIEKAGARGFKIEDE